MDNSTAAKRELAAKLRRLRLEARLSARLLSQRTGFSPSKISKIEHAKVSVSSRDITIMASAIGVSPPVARALSQAAKPATASALAGNPDELWQTPYMLIESVLDRSDISVSRAQDLVRRLEEASTEVKIFDPVHVCGLLQTFAYAWTIAKRLPLTDHERPSFLARRLQRQAQAMSRPGVTCLLSEVTLHNPHVEPLQMLNQLDDLMARIEAGRPRVGILASTNWSEPLYSSNFMIFNGEGIEIDGTSNVQFSVEPAVVKYHQMLMERMLDKASWDGDAMNIVRNRRDQLREAVGLALKADELEVIDLRAETSQ